MLIIDNRKESPPIPCGRCERAGVHMAKMGPIHICWECAHHAFSLLEDKRNPDQVYLPEQESPAITTQQEEWNRRLASGENLFFVTEEAMKAETTKYSEQA